MTVRTIHQHAAGTVISYSNLSAAAVAASDTAAALGAVRKSFKLEGWEITTLQNVADTLDSYGDALGGSSYFSVMSKDRPIHTLAEIAVESGQEGTVQDAAANFKRYAEDLRTLTGDGELEAERTALLYQYFRALAKTINRKLSSPGERVSEVVTA